jgi:hypothetical protein
MADLSTIKEEQIVKVDEHKAIKYKIVEEEIDLDKIKRELTDAKERLAKIVKPTDKELLEWAKSNYPAMNYEAEIDYLTKLIADNEAILKEV